jgi:hypothetical protein
MKVVLSSLALILFSVSAYASDVCSVVYPGNSTNVTASCTATLSFAVPQTTDLNLVIKTFEDNGYELRTEDSMSIFIFIKK